MKQFQSLFSWNSLSDTDGVDGTSSAILVSILVFVELALGLRFRCISGTMHMFQSLFSWNSLSDCNGFFASNSALLFQSLFSWNSLSDANMKIFVTIGRIGFNPCFRGTRSRTLQESLSNVMAGLCFNPCFRGTRSRTVPDRLLKGIIYEFQSLFSWNSLSDRVRHLCHSP